MTDHSAHPSAPATQEDRVAELHRLARADYASTAHLRRQNPTWPATPAATLPTRTEPREPGDLDVAISVAQQMLDTYGAVDYTDHAALAQACGAIRQSLRIILRALGAEPTSEAEAARRSVDAQFPTVAAFLASERGEDR
ncbi:hypothetical protein [Streptomyces thermodiastaticus]|jgi:hypothetical protein|uniref:hypothetical protein n=1 Tax=Streptomyces thermodiastaticus TaxID=44061 RepID=UPI0016764F2F|nr:hypothetical protein [Streptomyces thermodiastaticus]MCE7550887.1 hypothetical protein [Streptomyces thermodiastaticus]GHF74063.1 hypothetical protein GCM10018787_23450 [Streptomyces thermodiastaticus]